MYVVRNNLFLVTLNVFSFSFLFIYKNAKLPVFSVTELLHFTGLPRETIKRSRKFQNFIPKK